MHLSCKIKIKIFNYIQWNMVRDGGRQRRRWWRAPTKQKCKKMAWWKKHWVGWPNSTEEMRVCREYASFQSFAIASNESSWHAVIWPFVSHFTRWFIKLRLLLQLRFASEWTREKKREKKYALSHAISFVLLVTNCFSFYWKCFALPTASNRMFWFSSSDEKKHINARAPIAQSTILQSI